MLEVLIFMICHCGVPYAMIISKRRLTSQGRPWPLITILSDRPGVRDLRRWQMFIANHGLRRMDAVSFFLLVFVLMHFDDDILWFVTNILPD